MAPGRSRAARRPATPGIYTVAGDGNAGFAGDGGSATSAWLDNPNGVTVDSAGNLLIADSGNYRIRVVAAGTGSYYGQAMTTGDIYTVAGSGAGTPGALGTAGFSGDGSQGTKAEIDTPAAVAANGSNGLVFADSQNNRIRMVAG